MNLRNRVLIIESDRFTRELYQMVFEKSGFEVLTAKDGGSGITAIFSENPDVVLLEIVLPRVNGLQVLEEVRRREAKENKREIPIVVTSNTGQEEIVGRCESFGIKGYFIKAHYDPLQVVMEVKKLIQVIE